MPTEPKPSTNAMLLTEVFFVLLMAWLLFEYGDVWGKMIVALVIICLLVLMLVVFHPELARMLVKALANRIDDEDHPKPPVP